MEIKDRIRILMEERGLNQRQLSRAANINEPSMSKYLSGERTPRIDVIVNIANALGVTADELIGNEIESKEIDLTRLKVVLARGMKKMTEEEKKELIKFILDH